MIKALGTLLCGFLLGFLFNSSIYLMPEMTAFKEMMKTPKLNFYLPRPLQASEIRVLCWIMTGPSNHYTKAVHIKKTWGAHCDKLIFMSSQEDPELGAVALNISEGRQNLWGKTKRGFQYCYQHHRDQFDWFLKADDDTFMVIENLKEFLRPFDTNKAIHFGHHFKYLGGYFAGGAGYVLSREALRRFTEEGLTKPSVCQESDGGDEDVNMGACMRKLNVTHGDSRDEKKRKRFFPFTPQDHLIPKSGRKDWAYELYTKWPELNGTSCCSDTAISFHYISPPMLYVMYYLVYHLRPVPPYHSEDWELENLKVN